MAKQLSCGVDIMRGILLFLNIVFVIVGLALLGFGIYVKVDKSFASILGKLANMDGFEGQSLGFLAFALIGGGVLILLIALFGCMGTLWHNRCLLYMYAIILGLLMIVELVAFIMAFVYKGKLTEVYQTTLHKVFIDALEKKDEAAIGSFRDLETTMKCCGIYNVSDYNGYNVTLSKFCIDHPTSIGCSQAIIDFLSKNLPIIGGILGGVILLELLGLIGAIALAVAIKHAPDDNYSSRPGEVLSNIVPGRRRQY